jgi:hypothetical protein
MIVAETAFPWATNSSPIVGINPGVDGQVQFVIELAKIVKGVAGNQGAGICWWGTEYQRLPGVALAGFDTRSFFDGDGNTLPVAEALGRLATRVTLKARFTDSALWLNWPLSGAGMTLMTSTNLGPSGAWLADTNPVQSTGLVFSTILPGSAGYTRFFRLESR